jgi:hypothetical protein
MSTTTEKFAALLEEESERHTREVERILSVMLTVEDIVKQTGWEPDDVSSSLLDDEVEVSWHTRDQLRLPFAWLRFRRTTVEAYPVRGPDPIASTVAMLRDGSV